jgi:GT2 family glycosyltransferase
MAHTPLVSVVFVNYNGKELLKKALISTKKSTYGTYELIVVDNASTDGSQAMLKKEFPSVKLVQNKENLGYTGINKALPYCKGKYIFFLNNDLELDKHTITTLVTILETDNEVALAVPKLVNYHDRKIDSAGTWVSRCFYNGHYRADKVDATTKEIPYMGIGLIRKNIVNTFGYLFDPDYFIYAEDLDLGLRIRLLGMKTLYVPRAASFHMHSMTMKNVPDSKKTFLMERNLLTTFYKIPSLSTFIPLFPYVYGMRIITIVRDIFTLRFTVAAARLHAVVTVFLTLPTILKKRACIQKLRQANDASVFSIFTEKHLFSGKRLTI